MQVAAVDCDQAKKLCSTHGAPGHPVRGQNCWVGAEPGCVQASRASPPSRWEARPPAQRNQCMQQELTGLRRADLPAGGRAQPVHAQGLQAGQGLPGWAQLSSVCLCTQLPCAHVSCACRAGARTAKAISEAATAALPSAQITRITSAAALQSFKARPSMQPRVVLVSEKATASPLLRAMSLRFKGRLLFGSAVAGMAVELGLQQQQLPALALLPEDGAGGAEGLHRCTPGPLLHSRHPDRTRRRAAALLSLVAQQRCTSGRPGVPHCAGGCSALTRCCARRRQQGGRAAALAGAARAARARGGRLPRQPAC